MDKRVKQPDFYLKNDEKNIDHKCQREKKSAISKLCFFVCSFKESQ